MSRVLVAYASRHGSTEEVAVSVAQQLHAAGHRVGLLAVNRVETLAAYDAVVLGGALYTGRWHRDAHRFVRRFRRQLAAKPFATFAIGPRTCEPSAIAASREQLDAELARLHVLPDHVAVFGGAIDPRKLRFPFNRMAACDARDWNAINAWASRVARALHAADAGEPIVRGLRPERELSRSRG